MSSSINFKIINKNETNFNQKSDLQHQKSGYFESNSFSNLTKQRNNNNNNTITASLRTNNNTIGTKLVTSRAHQILLTNQMSLNNLVNGVNDSSSSSSTRMVNDRTFLTLTNDSNFSNYAPSSSGINSGRTSSQINLNGQSNVLKSNKILLKMPFKQYLSRNNTNLSLPIKNNVNNNEIYQTKEKTTIINRKPNPSNELILKTVQVVNNYVDQFEKTKFSQNTINNQQSHVMFARKIRANGFNKLRPLNYVFQTGPVINSCIGIIKEPENQTNAKLKEIYQYKLQLLQNKSNISNQQSQLFDNNQDDFISISNPTGLKSQQTYRSLTTPN